MANTIIGRVLVVGQTVNIPTKSGGTLTKRELVLDCSRYDQYTGEKRDNFPALEFVGQNCQTLDALAVGDMVQVAFVLAGRRYVKDGQERYFTSVTGYKAEPYQHPQATAQGQPAAPQSAPQPVMPQPAPQGAENKDDLPF